MLNLNQTQTLHNGELGWFNASVPTIEQIIEGCMELRSSPSVTHKMMPHWSRYTPQNFVKFVKQVHCQESLDFLMDIIEYEEFWNRVFKQRSSCLKLKSSRKRLTSQSTESLLGGATTHAGPTIFSSPDLTPQISALEASLPKILKLDENPYSDNSAPELKSGRKEAWMVQDDSVENLDVAASIEDNLSPSNGSQDEIGLHADATPSMVHQLDRNWLTIVEKYIKDGSPCEVNLTQEMKRQIEADVNSLHHPPLVLLGAKNRILNLLYSNVYLRFLDEFKEADQTVHLPLTLDIISKDAPPLMKMRPVTVPLPSRSPPSSAESSQSSAASHTEKSSPLSLSPSTPFKLLHLRKGLKKGLHRRGSSSSIKSANKGDSSDSKECSKEKKREKKMDKEEKRSRGIFGNLKLQK